MRYFVTLLLLLFPALTCANTVIQYDPPDPRQDGIPLRLRRLTITRCGMGLPSKDHSTLSGSSMGPKAQVEADPVKWASEEKARLVADLAVFDKELED